MQAGYGIFQVRKTQTKDREREREYEEEEEGYKKIEEETGGDMEGTRL